MTTLLYNEAERLSKLVASGVGTPEMELLSSLLGTGEEADGWLGYSGFWVEGGPKIVEDAIGRLPIELQESLWWDALDSAVTIRSLQLIRLTTCYSGNTTLETMPKMPIPESWLPLENDLQLGIHVDVGSIEDSSDPCWCDLILCVTVSSRVEIKILHDNIKLKSNLLVTHPKFKQSKKHRTLFGMNDHSGVVDAMVVGKVRYFGHTNIKITDNTIRLDTDGGLQFLKSYIAEVLRISEKEISLSHKQGSVIAVWFPINSNPRKLQIQLLSHESDYWNQVWECGSDTPDLSVQFPNRPCIKIAVSGREGSSPFVADEVLRRSTLSIIESREVNWKEQVVSKLTSSGSKSLFSHELLWCIIGGSIDLNDPYEVESIATSLRMQAFVPNRKPKFRLSSTPHKSHELFKKRRNRLRDSITVLNSKLTASLPYVDPITASQMGVYIPSGINVNLDDQNYNYSNQRELEYV